MIYIYQERSQDFKGVDISFRSPSEKASLFPLNSHNLNDEHFTHISKCHGILIIMINMMYIVQIILILHGKEGGLRDERGCSKRKWCSNNTLIPPCVRHWCLHIFYSHRIYNINLEKYIKKKYISYQFLWDKSENIDIL